MRRGAGALLGRLPLLALGHLGMACGGGEEERDAASGAGSGADTTAAAARDIDSYDELLAALHEMGLTVEPAGKIRQPFFSVQGEVVGVNGYEVEVFEYADEAGAAQDAGNVSPDGGSVGPTMVHWVSPPHFYRRGRLLVVYIGEDPAVAEALESVLGEQFAGR